MDPDPLYELVGEAMQESPEHRLGVTREQALANFYAAERRAGADPLTANGRMHEFAKRLDKLAEEKIAADDAFNRDLDVIRKCMERTR